jgi:hypothetical protein
MKVEQVMSGEPKVFTPAKSLNRAAQLMWENGAAKAQVPTLWLRSALPGVRASAELNEKDPRGVRKDHSALRTKGADRDRRMKQ